MKKKNILSLVLALALVAALAVGGTLAYFTDNDTEKNTFTMGHVDINLDESNGDKDKDGNEVWTDNGLTYDKVLPGAELTKKARVTVQKGSADCYVMVKVDLVVDEKDKWNGTTGFKDEDIEKLYDAVRTAIAEKSKTSGKNWKVSPATGNGPFQCVYDGIATENEELPLFDSIKIPGEEFKNNTANHQFKIELNAYAIQSDNVDPKTLDWNTQTFETYSPVPTTAPATNP